MVLSSRLRKGCRKVVLLSPLLANVVLNRLDWFLHGQGHRGPACDKCNGRVASNQGIGLVGAL